MNNGQFHVMDRPTGSVLSKDRTRIGYRQIGSGPGLVLIQGSFGTQHNFTQLAGELADSFTVYLPDRRGRGMSPRPFDASYSIERDVEDLEALLAETGGERVFGLSSGAVIALWAAASSCGITKVAAFEPPLLLHQQNLEPALARFDREVQQGHIAAAGVTGMLASQMGPPLLQRIPRPLLELATKSGLWFESKRSPGPYAPMRDLIPALRYDFTLIQQASNNMEHLADIDCGVLLLGAEKSPSYLARSLEAVSKILPSAERTILPGVGHGAAWNSDRGGNPAPVAAALRTFLT